MADVYEFHVAGVIGPVVRAALPELSAESPSRRSVLTGTAASADAVDELLQRIGAAGLNPTHILISRESRWHPSTAPLDMSPEVDQLLRRSR